jgi:hypothetical protein
MDLYLSALILGGLGLAGMAFLGGGRHGARGHATHAIRGGHATHGTHAARGAPSHHAGQQAHAHAAHPSAAGAVSRSLLTLVSPRILFSFALGFGAVGLVVRQMLSGPLQLAAAVAGGILFDRLFVTPLWNFGMRFESAPALTLESAVGSEASVVSRFDADGRGLISVELDGQVIQLLGTLKESDRAMGARLGAGSQVRIEEVDAQRNRCVVSLI